MKKVCGYDGGTWVGGWESEPTLDIPPMTDRLTGQFEGSVRVKGDGAGGGLNVKTVFVVYNYCISGVFLVFLQNEKIKITEYGYSRD